jgi:Eukaryotic aspartyl protease
MQWLIFFNIGAARKPLHTVMIVTLIPVFLLCVNALRLNIRGHRHTPYLNKRGHISGLDDIQNLQYFTNITLGEKPFSVSIDTGRQATLTSSLFLSHLITSSDLWVAGNVLHSSHTGLSTSVQYAIGSISGPVKTAQLTFLDLVVPDQAFSMFCTSSRSSAVHLHVL